MGEIRIMALRSIPSPESGDMDSGRLRCDLAECRGLENIEGAGLKSNGGKGESDMLLMGYCERALPGC